MIVLKKQASPEFEIKLFWFGENKWQEVTGDVIKGLMLMDLNSKSRLIFEVKHREGKFFVATRDDDVKAIINKHSGKYPVIPASKLVNFFKQERKEDELITLLPKVVTVINEFDAKVVN